MSNMCGWLVKKAHNVDASFNLFCFPYAGGSAATFNSWRNFLPDWINLYAIQLPGREARHSEPFCESVINVVDGIYDEIQHKTKTPYAFFGHSLGALISFELIRKIRNNGLDEPLLYFPSGRHAPQLIGREPIIHDYPEAEFIQQLKDYNGTNQVLLENTELMRLFLPRLRSDFKISETYTYLEGEKLSCPIVAISGMDKGNESLEDLLAWENQTIGRFKSLLLPGDHFFLHMSERELTGKIISEISERVSFP